MSTASPPSTAQDGSRESGPPRFELMSKALAWTSLKFSFLNGLYRCVRICRLSLIVTTLAGLLFLWPEQGREILRCLAEGPAHTGGARLGRFICCLTGLTLFSLAAWYFSRVLLYLKFPDSPKSGEDRLKSARWVMEQLPRIIGVLPPLLLAAGFVVSAPPYWSSLRKEVGYFLILYAVACVAVALLLGVLFWRRRKWLKMEPAKFHYAAWRGLPRLTLAIVFGSLGVSTLVFTGIFLWRVHFSQFCGSAAVILLAGASWIVYGSFFVYLGHRLHVPVVSAAVVLVLVFSFFNYNHDIRYLNKPARSSLPDFETEYGRWYSNICAKFPGEKRHPVIVVAAAGGGIRAAMWTAMVLGELQDRSPAFADHVFAISGVSGGSLGAAVFDALVKSGETGSYKLRSKDILARDFLSPTLACMLFPDMLQRFLPVPIESFDRARALEASWETGWEEIMGNSIFSDEFLTLWSGPSEQNVPCLFLNGTCLETGGRMVMSNVRLDSSFAGVEDLNSHLNAAVALSTAVDMSTRFSFVSPSGRLATKYHIVDGGYFENSGAATASDIVDEIEFLEDYQTNRVVPIVIVIANDPQEHQRKAPNSGFLSEALEPFLALLSSREARGYDAELHLETQMPGDNFYRFSTSRDDTGNGQASVGTSTNQVETTPEVPLPLGWSLSHRAIEYLDTVVLGQNEAGFKVLDRLPKKQ